MRTLIGLTADFRSSIIDKQVLITMSFAHQEQQLYIIIITHADIFPEGSA